MMPLKRSLTLILLGFAFLLSELLRPSREKRKTGVRARDHNAENDPAQDSTEKANSKQRNTCHPSPHSMSSSREVHEPHATNHDPNTQHCKNQKHWLEYAVFSATVVAAGGAIAAAIFTGFQAWIANEDLKASHRPWVKVDLAVGGDLKFGPDGTYVKVRFTTKSYGTTPAVGVHITPAIFLASPLHGDVIAEQTKICTQGIPRPPGQTISGSILFPGEEKITDIAIGVTQAQIEGVWNDMREAHKDNTVWTFFHPIIIGCATYRFTFDDTLHRTPFSAELKMIDLRSGRTISIDTGLGTIPASLLILDQETYTWYGGSYAN